MSDSSLSNPFGTVVLVGVLATDVVEGSRLHVRPDQGRAASLALPAGWRLVEDAIRDVDGRVRVRLGDRVTVTGQWIEGLVSLRGPSRVLRIHSIEPADASPVTE